MYRIRTWVRRKLANLKYLQNKVYALQGQAKNPFDLSQINLNIDDQPIERFGEGCNNKTFKFAGAYTNKVRKKLSSVNWALSRVII